jgi:ATP-dependent helicase/nuclease subunit A
MTAARHIALARQRDASDPTVSAFVTASAGSGKTKLLTDRILRLLLGGARPEGLLCLTFTKAAAAEMATRLNASSATGRSRRTPCWRATCACCSAARPRRMKPPRAPPLRRGAGAAGRHAHRHHPSFAQSLLRAFPLEAGLPPGFALLEEMDADAELAQAREAILPDAPEAAILAPLIGADRLARLLGEMRGAEERLQLAVARSGGFDGLMRRIGARLGLPPGADEAALAHEAAHPPEAEEIGRAAAMLCGSRNGNDQGRAAELRRFLALAEPEARIAALPDWETIFLTAEGKPRAHLATVASGRKEDIEAILRPEAGRLVALRERRTALNLLQATKAALGLAVPVLARFAQGKVTLGRQDYDDLIAGARRLLENPGAAWVLYKLDGGIEHVLLDEAQDSNPEQWGIARALTGEFFSGEGIERRGNELPAPSSPWAT